VDLDSAAEELYGAPADEFAEHRNRLAKQAKAAGDKALAASIGKLRKPVLAAALVNELVRAEPAELQELTQLGDQLRDAHRQLRGPELRALSEQRQQLLQRLTDLVRATAEQGGRTVTEPVLAQVRGTFEAAIADEGAEAAVLSGRLTTVLSYTGFGEVDVTDAVAVPVRRRHLRPVPDHTAPAGEAPEKPVGGRPGKAAPGKAAPGKAATDKSTDRGPSSSAGQARQRRLERHQEQLRRAEAEHAEATRTLEQAEHEAQATEQQHQEATARVEQLRAQLEQAQEEAWRAGQASRSAERARHSAEQEADRTGAALQAARNQLDALDTGDARDAD
jgi:chromosome segregation ATPase